MSRSRTCPTALLTTVLQAGLEASTPSTWRTCATAPGPWPAWPADLDGRFGRDPGRGHRRPSGTSCGPLLRGRAPRSRPRRGAAQRPPHLAADGCGGQVRGSDLARPRPESPRWSRASRVRVAADRNSGLRFSAAHGGMSSHDIMALAAGGARGAAGRGRQRRRTAGDDRLTEIIFAVTEDAVDGGYLANALGDGIHTQRDSVKELPSNVKEAVDCYFDDIMPRPQSLPLHLRARRGSSPMTLPRNPSGAPLQASLRHSGNSAALPGTHSTPHPTPPHKDGKGPYAPAPLVDP